MDVLELLFGVSPRPGAAAMRKAGIRPGLYHYVREESGAPVRFHLRVDGDGSGLLVAGAAAAARLHPSGVIIAKGLLEKESDAAIAARVGGVFQGAPPTQVADDVARVGRLLQSLETPDDRFPVFNLADPSFASDVKTLDRPLSADLPAAEPARIEPVLERLWEQAIPHVTLIAGANTQPAWLVRAVEKAEDLGLIAGVRARGTLLAGDNLIRDLAQAGVDYVTVPYLAADPEHHDALCGKGDHAAALKAIESVHAEEVCPMVEIALVERTLTDIEETIESLPGREVRNAGVFAVAVTEGKSSGGALQPDEVLQAAAVVEEVAAEVEVNLYWYPPVRFHLGQSLGALVLGGPRASGDTAVRVEPDGTVIPPRGPCHASGNLLTDPWERIARREPMRRYRKRVATSTHCETCPGLAICAADCPRLPEGWADGCMEER